MRSPHSKMIETSNLKISLPYAYMTQAKLNGFLQIKGKFLMSKTKHENIQSEYNLKICKWLKIRAKKWAEVTHVGWMYYLDFYILVTCTLFKLTSRPVIHKTKEKTIFLSLSPSLKTKATTPYTHKHGHRNLDFLYFQYVIKYYSSWFFSSIRKHQNHFWLASHTLQMMG